MVIRIKWIQIKLNLDLFEQINIYDSLIQLFLIRLVTILSCISFFSDSSYGSIHHQLPPVAATMPPVVAIISSCLLPISNTSLLLPYPSSLSQSFFSHTPSPFLPFSFSQSPHSSPSPLSSFLSLGLFSLPLLPSFCHAKVISHISQWVKW